MKRKFTFLMAAFMLLALFVLPMKAWATDGDILNETFEDGSSTVSSWSFNTVSGHESGYGQIDNNSSNAHGGSKFVHLGSGSNAYGSATTPTLSAMTENATMTFWAKTNTNNHSLKLSATGCTIDQTSIVIANGTWTQYTVNITNGTSSAKINFYKDGSTKKYIYIDDVVITSVSGGGGYNLSSEVTPAGAGTVTLGATSLETGQTTTAQATPTNSHFSFTSWSITGEGAELSSPTENPTTVTMGTANATVTAAFTEDPKYSITYNANYTGSTDEPVVVSNYAGESMTIAPYSTFTRTGYAITSWNTVANGGGTTYSAGDSYTMTSAGLTLYAQWEASNEIVDELTATWTGVTGTTYTEWSGKTITNGSGAVYAGNTSNNGGISLRTKNSNEGIITTTSGGLVRKVAVTWQSTTANRTINVYGKNSPYSAVSDLFNTDNQGTLLGTIVYGTSTELSINGDYAYVGLRSAQDALVVDPIQITWEPNSAVATTTTIDHSGITNTDVNSGTAAGSLSATVKDNNNETITGATVTWSGNNDAVATINASTGAVTLVAAGTVTFTATYAGASGTYQSSFATYEMTVTSSAPYVQPTEIEIVPNYTFWGQTAQFSGDTNDELSGSKDNVSLNWTRGNGSMFASTTAMRFYKDNTLTFTAPTGYEIKSIVITFTQTQTDLTFSPEGYSLVETTGTWTGASQTVTMTRPSNASSYAQITNFTITIGLPSSIATPTFSPDGGTYTEAQTVTISCTTAGATIYYTTDGTTPSASNGTQGTSVNVNTSMTLKAIAIKNDESSAVATAEYTINLPAEYATVAAFKAAFSATSNEVVKITGTLTVVYQNGKYLYVQDATGGLLVFDNKNKVTGTYENGQTISNIYGTYTNYYGQVEFVPDRDFTAPGTGVAVEPTDIAELTTTNYSTYDSRLVRLSDMIFDDDATWTTGNTGSNVDMEDNDYNVVVLRNGFKTLSGSIAAADMANVTGFATIYTTSTTTTIQLFPRDNNDIQMILPDMDVTSDVTVDFAAVLESGNDIIVEDGGVLTIGGSFTNNGDLLIENGGQMKCNSAFTGTIQKSITGYENYTGTGNGGYYLIASPVDAFVNPTLVPTNSNDEYLFDDMDFYWFDGHEVGQEWQNPKNGSADGSINGLQLMPSKKGFLYARKETGVISISADNNNKFPATGTDIVADNLSNVSTPFGKYNLIGNPYTCNAFVGRAYYRMNAAGDGFTAAAASEPIKPLEGVFIVFGDTETATEVTFTTTDPASLNAGQNNGNISITASQVVATRGNNNDVLIDRAIVNFGEGETLPKFMLNPDNTKLYIPQNGKDYAVVRSEARGEMPVNFKAAENGTYTIDVEAENLEVNYLHLIDNMTGMDVDLLATPSYTFEGKKSDYASRFKLVFNANAGNNEVDEDFAFISDGNIIILNEGEATLQVIDIMGRIVNTQTVNGNASVNNVGTAGVYVLQLINGNNVKTQKIVVR